MVIRSQRRCGNLQHECVVGTQTRESPRGTNCNAANPVPRVLQRKVSKVSRQVARRNRRPSSFLCEEGTSPGGGRAETSDEIGSEPPLAISRPNRDLAR